jgi:hypothetical protein
MALQLRRGLDGAARTAITPGIGEIIYTTDTKKVFVGDGTTAGGNPVSPVVSVNTQTGVVVLGTDNITEGSTNKYFTDERAQDAAAAMLVAGTHSGITFTYGATQDGANRIDASVASSSSVINTGTANSLGYYAANGTTLSPSSSLTWDEAGNTLQNINGTIAVVANNSNRATIVQSTFNSLATGNNSLSFLRGRGTNITPAAVQSLDNLHSINWSGYDGTRFSPAVSIAATVGSGTVSTGIVRGVLLISTTDSNGVHDIRLRVDNTGLTTLGPALAGDTGSGSLRITQTTSSNTGSTTRTFNYYNDQFGVVNAFYKYRGTFASPLAIQSNDQILNLRASGWDGAALRVAASIQFFAEGTITSSAVPGRLEFYTTNAAGTNILATSINSSQLLTHNGSMSVSGSLTHSGLKIGVPNYITVGSTGTFVLSATASINVLLVGSTGYTATLTFPSSPVDGQVCQFSVHTNTVTLALTAGPTLSGTFAGSVTAPTTFTYIYRTTGTTWYRVQ